MTTSWGESCAAEDYTDPSPTVSAETVKWLEAFAAATIGEE